MGRSLNWAGKHFSKLLKFHLIGPLGAAQARPFESYRGYRTIYPPLSNYPGQNRVEIAGSLKLRAFWGADSPKPILKLFSVEIVISSRDDKSRNCWSVEIATKPHLAKSENCQHVEIVVKFSTGALRARVEIARKPALRRTNSKHFPLLEAL